MNCLQILPRFSALSLRSSDSHRRSSYESQFRRDWGTELTNKADRHRSMSIKASSAPDNIDGKTSETYSNNMTEAMGAVLTYKHENGINWNFIREDLIVGSCLQTPADVDKLREIGVKTIYCLQQDPDLEYFGVDIGAIQRYAEKCDDIEHLRAEIRDFDMHDLRVRLPAVISKLDKAIGRNGGVTYIHCTAGLGRAPAVALAYMFWVSGYRLSEAHSMILSKRACFPKVDAIKAATADILIGMKKETVELTWKDTGCSSVAVAGLDVGWGQSIPLQLDGTRGIWIAKRELLEGRYEYKYVVDGDWVCSEDKPMTQPNKDGHVNNYVDVVDVDDIERASIRRRMFDDDVDLLPEERRTIKQFLQSYHPEN